MLTHPDVEDVGVIGLPDPIDGELPMAFVVLRPNKSVTDEELVKYINGMFTLKQLSIDFMLMNLIGRVVFFFLI